MEYSIVIPAYNEADKITATLTQVVSFMRTFSKSSDFEVLVVNDGSKDNTAKMVSNYIINNPEVKLIDNPHKGKGPTVYKGIMEANGTYIYMADADLSTPISEIKKLLLWIKDHNFDIVIASREGTGAQRLNEPLYRHIMGRGFNFIVQTLALPGIKDSQCGFKLYKAAAAKNVFSKLKVYGESAPVVDKAFLGAFDVEMLYVAKKMGYKVKEVPVVWTHVKTTRINPIVDSIKMFKDVLLVRLNDLKGMYK